MRIHILPIAALLAVPSLARADTPTVDELVLHVDTSLDDCEVHFAPELTQPAYRRFVREFGSVSAFKQMGAPGAIAAKGVSLGIQYMEFHVDERSDAWNHTFSHPAADHWLGSDKQLPKLEVRVGVGGHTDVGAYFTLNPEANYGWLGVDVEHALFRQDPETEMPVTIAVRGAYTKTLFVDDMDMHAATADASVGHTFRYGITPYAGVGADAVVARETSEMVDLDTEYLVTPHLFVGLEVAWRHLRFATEGHVATVSSWQGGVAWVF